MQGHRVRGITRIGNTSGSYATVLCNKFARGNALRYISLTLLLANMVPLSTVQLAMASESAQPSNGNSAAVSIAATVSATKAASGSQDAASTADSGTKPQSDGSAKSLTTSGADGNEIPLRGHLVEDIDSPNNILADLVKTSIDRDVQSNAFLKKNKKYGKNSQSLLQRSKDVANFVTSYKGFERSSEAADVILNEKLTVKSKASAVFLYQRKVDDFNSKIFSTLLQMSTGLGMPDGDRKKQVIDSAVAELATLVGDDAAHTAYDRMKTWSESVNVAEAVDFNGRPMDVLETESKVKTAVNGALENDDVVAEIKTHLHKYNRHSKFMRGTAKIVNTTLSIAMLAPNFISPAAQVAYLAFCVSTGGPEDAKLLQELYLDQRFQSRWKVYNHKAELAVNSYNLSLLSKNQVALRFSQNVLADMESGKTGMVTGDLASTAKKSSDVKQTSAVKTDKTSLENSHKNDSASKGSLSL
jgi:hypothetical protein